MILIGCLSILSGVVVAALHHHDNLKPVPQQLRKLFRITHLTYSSLDSSPRVQVAGGENDVSATVTKINGHLAGKNQNGNLGEVVFGKDDCLTLPHLYDKAKMVNQEDSTDDVKDYSAAWKKLAGSINMLLFVVSSVLTVASVTITIILYVMVHE